MSCGALAIGSETAPVAELIENGKNGLLVDFFDVDRWVDQVLQVLDDPAAYNPLRRAARQTILDSYTLPKCLDKMLHLYREVGVGDGRRGIG